MLELNSIYQGDCLQVFKGIATGAVDMVLMDLPYGVTRMAHDSVIPLDKLWPELRRITKPSAAIVLTGQDLFTAQLMLSNEKMHRYNLIWDKVLVTGHLNANRMPMRQHEDVMVFYRQLPTYNPQKTKGAGKSHSKGTGTDHKNQNYGKFATVHTDDLHGEMKFPTSILRFPGVAKAKMTHPTEKPVALFENLIRMYSNPGELVLDGTAGSFVTAEAAQRAGRKWICVDQSAEYCRQGAERMDRYQKQALGRLPKRR